MNPKCNVCEKQMQDVTTQETATWGEAEFFCPDCNVYKTQDMSKNGDDLFPNVNPHRGSDFTGILPEKRGYHIKDIRKGKYGTLDKVREELEEAVDAEQQGNKLMLLVELSDIVGAIRGYLETKYPNILLEDLVKMSDATSRAFIAGLRK